ncbi:MAG: hypothetical protein JNK60_15680, partial [Acidobacteria bacterium]|nr:hypothetical protein [Acidobacteriota bacterium]
MPAESFESHRLVTVRMLPSQSFDVPLNAGLSLGAFIELDFEGRAARSLVVRIPMPQDAVVGRQAFVGRPTETPWGKRLQFLSAGRVIDIGGQKFFSNGASDRPGDPPSVPRGSRAAGLGSQTLAQTALAPLYHVQNPWCTTVKIPCGTVCPDAPPSPPGCNAALTAPVPPGCNSCDCDDYLCSVLEEFGSRGRAAAVYSAINEAMTLAGSLADYLELNELNFAFNILYIAFQDTFIFVPPPGNWSGRFALPVQPDVPFDVVVRNRNTGWIEATRSYSGVAFSPDLVDIGGLGGPSGSPATSPLLIDATPFAVTRFLPRSVPPTATQPDCETVVLGVEACSTAQGVVELRPATDLPLAEYSRLAFFNVSTAPAAGPSAEVGASGTFATLTLPARARDDLMLVVSPADVESENLSVLKLSFDQALRPISSSVALLVDCGALPGDCASATPVVTTAELSPQRSQLWVKIEGSLSRGRLYKLSLDTNLLVADASPNPPYQGPATFFLATRRQALTPVGGTSGLVLGDTAHAREILKLGNILFAASVTGRLVALDLTSAPSGSPPRMNPTALAATSGPASQIRGLATDGHGRIIYSALEGASWVVKVARLEDFQRVTTSGTSPPPPECDASGSNGRPPCACGLPFVPSVPMGCVNPTVGGVRTAFSTGFTAGLLGPEFLAVAGSLPSGTPVDIDVLVQDKNPDGKALPLGEFFARRPSGSLPAPGPDGFRTFAVDLSRNAPPQIQPQPRLAICDESSMDRFRRVSIDNLTTGQTWSFDMLDPAWGGPAGTEIATDIRARDNDLLQIRYNQRTWVYQAIVGSGITVVDVNRFYRTVSSPSSEPELLLSQCGRRLSAYEGQEIDFGQPLGSPGAIPGLFYTTGIAAIGQSEAGSVGGTIAGAESAEVYSALRSFGAVRSTAYVRSPDLLHGGKDDLRNLVPGRITNVRDVVALTDFEVPDPANGNRPGLRDLVFYTVFEGGVLVYDVTHRALTRFGRLGVPAGGAVNRLTLDRANARLFGEGTMAEAAGLVPKVFVWDITNPRGDPPAAPSQDPRLVSVLDAPSDAGLVVDSLTGLLYTWQNGSTPQTSGARTFAFGDPGIHALARLHGSSSGGVNLLSYELTDLVAPLGTPLRATVAEDLTNASEDDSYVSGAIRLRAALPAGLGDELTVKVQSLTERPDDRHLADEDLGAFVGVPGGSRWGKSEVFVTLKRLSLASGRSGPLSELGSLYESVESIVFVSDPRALDGHTLQQATNTEADEESQCRRCKRPPHYPLPSAGTTDPVVEVMATGPYARFVLAEDPSNPSQATQDALAFLRSMGGHYRIPHGLVSLTGWAASIPSPFQSALAEPVLEPAIVETEAGTSVVLTSGEVLISTVDHGVAGRGLGFALDRSYRSQLLGYGPLGAAGFTSSLFAEVRRIPLFGRNCLSPEYGRTGTLVEFHDGEGQVYRFATKNPCPGPSAPVCPAGFVEDGASPYCPAKGLYMRLADEAGGGLRLYGENFDSLVFDSGGRLVEVRDRLRRNASRAEEQGNTLLLSRHPSGRLESVEDELGRKYTFQYDDEPYDAQGRIRPTFGLLTKVVDHADGDPAARREIDYVFDTERRLLAVRYPEVALRQASGGTTSTRPELRYHYAPAPLTPTAPHGAFAEARLTGFTIPGGSVPRLSIA